jgi:hypothetical protein
MKSTQIDESREKDMRSHIDWVEEPIHLSNEEMIKEIRRLRKIIGTARVRLTRINDENNNLYADAYHACEILGCGMNGGEGCWP